MAGVLQELFGTKKKAELTPEIAKQIDQAQFLIRNVKKQMRGSSVMGNWSYHGQMDDCIALLEHDIELLERGKATEKNLQAFSQHEIGLKTCAANLIEHFEEEYAIQCALREKYLKEKQILAKKAEMENRKISAPLKMETTETEGRLSEASADWKALYEAARSVQEERNISEFVLGGRKAAALLSETGNIYTGISVDAAGPMGISAEQNAFYHMLTEGEDSVSCVLVVGSVGEILLPGGAGMELIAQIMPETYAQVQIMTDYEKGEVVTLGELMPFRQN